MQQSRKQLNEVLDFLITFHGLDSNSNSALDHSLEIPNGLSDLFRKHANWMTNENLHPLFWNESLAVSDGTMYGMDCPKGWIVFSQEHVAVWVAACPASILDDTEVAICSDVGITKMPSLNLFLIWLLLQESVWIAEQGISSKHGIDDNDYWSSQGFSNPIDCSFNGGEGFVQLFQTFRLSNDGKTIAHGDNHESHLSLRSTDAVGRLRN